MIAFSTSAPLQLHHTVAIQQSRRSLSPRLIKPQQQCRTHHRVSMVAKPENEPDVKVSATVERLYDTYPFPPETLLDEPPIGYNWRWHYPSVHAFCTGTTPTKESPRILDAGCGTGESTSYLVHLNPTSEVVAVDLSAGALQVAQERLERSLPNSSSQCTFIHKSLFDLADIDGQFDHINCVGVIHHTPDPLRALRALASKLAPGGICHIFVYGVHGRWEISLMQRALKILQPAADASNSSFEAGVALGRRVFEALPDGNRIKERENQRWAQENKKDATFADMYLHPQEVDYDIPSLFDLIEASGLDFVAFSNPRTWDLSRLLGSDPELLAAAQKLPLREQCRLVELLDPESMTHFEFFLSKPPLHKHDWSDDASLGNAIASISPCIAGWPSTLIMDRDYMPQSLSAAEHAFMKVVSDNPAGETTVGSAVESSEATLADVRRLVDAGLVMLTPL